MVYPYNGILVSNKMEWTIGTHYNIASSQNDYAEWTKADKKYYVYTIWFHLYTILLKMQTNLLWQNYSSVYQ